MIFSGRLEWGQKNGGWKFLPSPAILNRILRQKLQNFISLQNSEFLSSKMPFRMVGGVKKASRHFFCPHSNLPEKIILAIIL